MFKKTSVTEAPNAADVSADSVQPCSLGEITIVLRPSNIAMTQYVGTRVQLEDEGIIPAGTMWPDGFGTASWEADGLVFRLKREKPDGAKGPRRDFLNCDNWCLRVARIGLNWPDEEIERNAIKLAKMLYEQTPEGRTASNRRFEAYWAAKGDEKYQAFKALIPGLVPPPRKRRRPTAG